LYQNAYAIAIGAQAGAINQLANSIAIGVQAGYSYQNAYSVAIGDLAGQLGQARESVAIGIAAGRSGQGSGCVAIGPYAGTTSQSALYATAIGWYAGNDRQGSSATAVGQSAGQTSQGACSVAIGFSAGFANQGSGAVAIGNSPGQNQGSSAVAIGTQAGVWQLANAIALGYNAGYTPGAGSQGVDSIAIGTYAGYGATVAQAAGAVAIGCQAGYDLQGGDSVAIGTLAGRSNQGSQAIAIGLGAGSFNQPNSSICIGFNSNTTTANSICISGQGAFSPVPAAAGLFVKPIRSAIVTGNVLSTNTYTSEITASFLYSNVSGNVAIGTTTTPYELNVVGNVYATRHIHVGDSTRWFTGASDGYLASFIDSTCINTKSAAIQIGSANANFKSFFLQAFSSTASSNAYFRISAYGGGGINIHGTATGTAFQDNNSTSWSITSDEKIKENIELANLDICYENIKRIPLKRYSYKECITGAGPDKMRLGWIAQEVQTFFPKAVMPMTKEGVGECLGLNVDQLNATLYGAVQKLIQKVEILEAKVKELSPQ
jgi:hypothetical protein